VERELVEQGTQVGVRLADVLLVQIQELLREGVRLRQPEVAAEGARAEERRATATTLQLIRR
jgi:hypothetical protein